MSAALAAATAPRVSWSATDAAPVRVALLGTGAVGSAFLQRLRRFQDRCGIDPVVVHVANSRRAVSASDGLDPTEVPDATARGARPSRLDDVEDALGGPGASPRVVVDATASADVALRHAHWLARGIHVVTASKIASGGSLREARRLVDAAGFGATTYGDSATVGAGLPVLRAIRELRRGGDTILGIAGVLSGSLAWMLGRYDGSRPFRAIVEEARELGYTEPDPRVDLSGEDVRRKLLILARAAGASLEPEDVLVDPLLPVGVATRGPRVQAEERLAELDARLAACVARAEADGTLLRYVARWDSTGARVGLEAVRPNHPVAPANGCDNRVVVHSSRYRDSPLILQGAGAGPGVTAAALLDDVLRIVVP